jgi:alpha-methylacyl-CoA racemase
MKGISMGPLTGIRVIEIASAAPAPFACMLLADHGADVVRVDRAPTSSGASAPPDPLARSRRSVAVDMKSAGGVEVVRRLTERADVIVEGFRPGVMERLGLGPESLLAANPGLVYARMTGWGQEGPLAPTAGHDIDYIAVAGALAPIGHADRPVPPLNLVGDFGGGGMLVAFGILAALLGRASTGRGQVVDAAMVDGASLLMAATHGMRAAGNWTDEREANLLDGGAPFYTTYETSDGKFMAVGALEARFYRHLLVGLNLDRDPDLPRQMDRARWGELRHRFTQVFKTRTRAEWTAVFADVDACVAPVMGLSEAAEHEHMRSRNAFVDVGGVTQPAPAPRFGHEPYPAPTPAPLPGEHTYAVLTECGYSGDQIDALVAVGAVAAATSETVRLWALPGIRLPSHP